MCIYLYTYKTTLRVIKRSAYDLVAQLKPLSAALALPAALAKPNSLLLRLSLAVTALLNSLPLQLLNEITFR